MIVRYVLAKLLGVAPILLGVSLLVFALVHLVPGDVVTIMLHQQATPEKVHEVRELFGLDRPFHLQYLR